MLLADAIRTCFVRDGALSDTVGEEDEEADDDYDLDLGGGRSYRSLFRPSERSELLFRVVRWLVTGGPLCQMGENWAPIAETAKLLYKDLVTVGRTATGAIAVTSAVYEITGLDLDLTARAAGQTSIPAALAPAAALFPAIRSSSSASVREAVSRHSLCLCVVDAGSRQVTLLYHPWAPWL
jgi:hypothetical protein